MGQKSNQVQHPAGLLLGFLLVEFLFLLLAGGNALLAMGQPLSPLIWPISLGLTLATIGIFYLFGYCNRPVAVGLAIGALVILAFSVMLAAAFFDVSWDGQTYHQEAIIRLSEGWNPFVTELANLYSVPMKALEAAINFYPKAPWIEAATFNLFFGDIEKGKAIFWLLAVAAVLVSFSWVKEGLGLSLFVSTALVAAMALNPVAVSQSLSFYIDGQVYYLLVIVLVCLGSAMQPGQLKLIHYPLFLMSVSLLLNTKVPAIAFTGLLMIAYLCVVLFRTFVQRKKGSMVPAVLFSASALFGLVVMGFHPYVTNALDRGNPLYPVVGADKIIVIDTTRPEDFNTMNRFEMFYRSIFGRTDNPPYLEYRESRLKPPFSVNWPQEARVLENPDPRTGGFGPLFSGVLLLSLVLAIAIGLARRRGRGMLVPGLVILVLLVATLVHPEAWWARYVPHFYLVPLVLAIWLAGLPGLVPRVAVFLVSGLLIVNGLVAAVFYYPFTAERTRQARQQLDELAARNLNEVNFLEFRSNRARLEQRDIPFVELVTTKGYDCSDVEYFPKSRTYVCVDRIGIMPKNAFACTSQDLLVIWQTMPGSRQRELQAKGSCIRFNTQQTTRIETRQGSYVQIMFPEDEGSGKPMWTWGRFLPDPTTPAIP